MSALNYLRAALALSLAALLLPAPALADGKGLMLGGGIYYTELDEDFDFDDIEDPEDLGAFFDDKSGGFSGQVGWRFNKWISVDGGYWDLGEFKSDRTGTGDKIRLDTSAFTVGGMFSVPLWVLDLYGRAGWSWWEAESRRIDMDGDDPYYGLGVALNIGGSLDLYLEWVRFDFETNVDSAGIGVRFTF